jgi:hypothetical protein
LPSSGCGIENMIDVCSSAVFSEQKTTRKNSEISLLYFAIHFNFILPDTAGTSLAMTNSDVVDGVSFLDLAGMF